MMQKGIQRYKNGTSGAYSEEYHRLLGKSPWIVIRHLDSLTSGGPSLSEGDVATVFSQFGEVTDVRFVRHHRSGKFLGTAFVRYEDHRSAIWAADTMNSAGREGGRPARPTAAAAAEGTGTGRAAEGTGTGTGTGRAAEGTGRAAEGTGRAAEGTGRARGVRVERCEAAEVVALPPGTQSYAEWVEQLRTAVV